jgi:hypothetical protein
VQLHSTLDGRAGEFRLRGAAWDINSATFRGFLYLVPAQGSGNGRYRVVEAEGEDLWNLLDALSEQVASVSGASVKRLYARAVAGPMQSVKTRRPTPELETH